MFGRRKNPPPPPEEPRPRRRRRREKRPPRRSKGVMILALIGLAAVLFVLIRYVIVPLLVWIG